MKSNINKIKEKDVDKSGRIGPDQPFDYDEVASTTDPEYVRHMNRDGLSCTPYEEVKKNIPGYYLPEDTCVWMRAGIINFRRCDYDYDCYNCPFDQAMISAIGEKIAPAQEERRAYWLRHVKEKYEITTKPCIHYLSGRITSPEECTVDYKCDRCTVHELLDNETEKKTVEKSVYKNVSGYRMVEDYYYHFGHSWVHIEDNGRIKIGVDEFTSKVLGTLDAINLPPVGVFLKQGEIGCILTRNNQKAPIQSPVSGTVYSVNDDVKNNPKLAHDNPFHEGWLYTLDAENLQSELAGLYTGRECFQWMEKESQNLFELLGSKYEKLAATGGEPLDDIFGHFPEITWDRLVKTLFRTAEKR